MQKNYSDESMKVQYDITIHMMLDTLYLLGYITTDEFDKAYNPGGANE